jgi:F-type H+-transporting ATPase subunit a
MAAGHSDTFHHVRDYPHFELPQFLGGNWHLPAFGGMQLTKMMVLQLVAALLTIWVFRGLAKKVVNGDPARGPWWNFWESIALFIRDEVVRPTIGDGHDHDHDDAHAGHDSAVGLHPADKYLPFIWTCFFYILFCNLLGMIPWLGSPTGNINVTGALAVVALGYVVIQGSKETGAVGFWKSLVPDMDLPGPLAIFLVPLVWGIEFVGMFIKHGVLAIRLFANIMAGHTVLGVMLGFIATVAASPLFYLVAPASVLGQVGIGLLELFFAFVQAYIFAFLTTLFIGMAVHPH